MRRALWIGLVVFICGLALPAAGAEAIEARMEGVAEGETVQRVVSLRASASSSGAIERLQLFIGDDLAAERRAEGSRTDLDLVHEWDTRRAVGSGASARNGEYRVRAVAIGRGGAQDEDAVNVLVGNAPARPSGLKVSVTRSRVSLSWDANSEPDLIGYRVERSRGGRFRAIAQTTEPAYAERPGRGIFSYRVSAVRAGARPSERLVSAPSSPGRASTVAAGASARGLRQRRGLGDRGLFAGTGSGARFGRSGLPAQVGLPGGRSVGRRLVPGQEWGTYDETLPYQLGGQTDAKPVALSGEREVLGVIPADGLRWVAAGLLLVVCAALLRLLALGVSP